MKAPLFRLLVHIASVIPCQRTYLADGHGGELFGFNDETVIRPCLPVPIGSRLGEIAKSLLALSKRIFGALLVFDIAIDTVPFYDVSEFVTQRLSTAQEPAIFPIRPADAFYVLVRIPVSTAMRHLSATSLRSPG